jgi:alpha-1,3-glucan synthase
MSTQLRYGGDLRGLQDSLDYLQGMGLKTLYIIGSPFLNMPWISDGYSPLDLTLLDSHFGNIQTWREVIDDIHRRGMYVIFDNTFATMGDLLGFEGYLNTSAPFEPKEYNAVWKSDRRYHDFVQSNDRLDSCDYPRFWDSTGRPVENTTEYFVGCRDSEFDQASFILVLNRTPLADHIRSMAKLPRLAHTRSTKGSYQNLRLCRIASGNGYPASWQR